MSVVTVFDGSQLKIDQYDAICARTTPAVWDQPQRSFHVCYESGEGFTVLDVWDSEEAFSRFGEELIGPAIAAEGIELEPRVHRVHNVHTGAADRNVATVAEIYAAFGRGDIPAIIDRLADDVDWEAGRTDDYGVPWLRPGRGKEHVLSFFETLKGVDFKHFQPTTITGSGNTVLALIELEAVVQATGRDVDDLEVHVWTFHPDGRVASLRHVVDTVQHAAAVQG